MEFINYIIYLGGWRSYLFSYECIWDVLQSRKKYKKEMSCCDDPTAHQPPASAPVASVSVIKTLKATGESVECPDPVVAAAMLEATQLTDREREIILGVLGRDELLRRDQHLRVLQLKAELQNLRRKGALKPSTDLDITGPDQDPDRYCRRCRVELGRVINRGAYCRACRLKVCKACREYSFRTTDWVCTVCKKQMEIQAASGEWMNEFVKRPNKRRENRVCLPTADIIKRTIRRSWTISNPTPRWSTMRGSPELRPYNSLPRKQDINNYPSLALHQSNLKNQEVSPQEAPSPTYRRRSPRRTQSEDIYDDQGSSSQYRGISPVAHGVNSPDVDVFSQRPSRMNPLSKLSDGRLDIERRRSPMRRSNEGSSEDGSSKEDGSPKSKGILTPESARKFDRNYIEKRVSFESHVPYTKMASRPTPVLRTQSLIEGRVQNHLPSRYPVHHEDNSDNSEEAAHGDVHDSREENNSIELCEIEPFSGTVFRKMMVRRRRQNNARSISGSASNCSTAENEIIKCSEEKEADSNTVEEMRNEQEQVKYDYEYLSQQDKFQDYIAMISTSNLPMFVNEANRERFIQPETGVNISNNTMETEQEYQSEDTLPNSNEEVQETYYARDDEGMECHSNTDIMLDQILETLVSNGLELEFLLTKHIKRKQEATPECGRKSYNARDLSHDASNVTTTVKETNLTLVHLTSDTVSDAVQCTNAEEREVTSSNKNELTEKQIEFQDPYNISNASEKKTCITVELKKDVYEKPKYEPSSDDMKILVASSKEKNENSEEKRSCLSTSETMEQKTSLHKSNVHDSSNISNNIKIFELQPTGKVQEQSRSSKKMEIGVKFVNYISNGLKQSKICTSKRERESVEKLPLTHQVPSCPEKLDLQTTSDREELQKTDLPGNGEDSKVESVEKLPLTHRVPSCPEQLDLQTTSEGEELQKTDLQGNGEDSKVESVEKLPLTHQVPSCPEQLDLKTISNGGELQKTDFPENGKDSKVTMSQYMAEGLEKSQSHIINHVEEIHKTIQNTNEEKTQDEQVKLDLTNDTASDVEEIICQGRKQEVHKSQVDLQLNTDISCATELIQSLEETCATQADLENPVDNSTQKKLEEVNKDELESSIQEEFVNCKNKSTTSKKSVKRLVTCLVPRIKCKSSNSEEEDQLLELKETAQTDDMVTMSVTENSQDSHCESAIDKQEKYNLPNLDEFHEILDTMSTVCTSPQSIQGGEKEPIRKVREASQTVGDIDWRYEQQIEDIPQKEGKPLIIISSTISKSVPEITKTSEDGNNKLPLRLKDEAGVSEAHSSPMLASPRNGTKSATTSPVRSGSKRVGHDWHHEEDLDRIVGLHGRASLSTLGARSDSMASVYSGAGEGRYGSVAVRGQVEFGLQYNYKAGALEIQIKQCRDLAPVDIKRNRSDPYVKVYLLPDKSKSGKRKTKVKKHTLNPVFDECLKFHISLNGLETRTLWLTVWHSDMFGRNDFLGEVMMTLENKVFDDPTPKWYNLQERTEPFEDVSSYKGDIIVCLKFVPPDMTIQKKGKRSRGALHVLIKEAKALTAVKANGTSDPFCKSYLLPDKGRSSKQKTPIARRTTNPVWNYTFVYDDVSLQELAERCLELTVWDHDRLASNEFLGGVRFSLGTGKHYGKPVDWMDASGREMSLWKNMLEKPNFWVEGSLSLRSSLESRGS